jgi:hypothetical protein
VASKALIVIITTTAVLLAGCATTPPLATTEIKQELPPPPAAPRKATAAKPPPAPPEPSRPPADQTAKKIAPPRGAQIMSLVEADTSWIDYGSTFLVTRRNTATVPTVPLFRQAIVVAAVRAALAGLPAEPTAEFSGGALTLSFARGSAIEVASAINRAIAVPEVLRLRVVLRG